MKNSASRGRAVPGPLDPNSSCLVLSDRPRQGDELDETSADQGSTRPVRTGGNRMLAAAIVKAVSGLRSLAKSRHNGQPMLDLLPGRGSRPCRNRLVRAGSQVVHGAMV
jgi:hypothetical protein